MTSDQQPAAKPVILSFKFVGTALIGSLTMSLVAAFAPAGVQVATLGAFVSILGGLFVAYMEQEEARERRREDLVERLAVPLALSRDPDLYAQYLAISKGLTALAAQSDPILREVAGLKLGSVAAEVEQLSGGRLVYAGTEAWRTVYERLLASPELKTYRSVAWVRGRDYWQDPPGRRSMLANFEAAFRGVLVERVVILADHLWPGDAALPVPETLAWLREQHDHGLWVTLVRESAVAEEPDLLCDFGVYGERAVGIQTLDERCRTLQFELTFDPRQVLLFGDRWHRLGLFAVPFRSLLDGTVPGR